MLNLSCTAGIFFIKVCISKADWDGREDVVFLIFQIYPSIKVSTGEIVVR